MSEEVKKRIIELHREYSPNHIVFLLDYQYSIDDVNDVLRQYVAKMETRIAQLEAERDALAARVDEDAKSIVWSVMMFWAGNDGHHVLRLVQNGTWSADKAAEVLRVMLHGETVELPPVVVGAVYCGDDPTAILAARDTRMKREGKREALRGVCAKLIPAFSLEGSQYCKGWNDGLHSALGEVRAAIAALEKEGEKG